MPRLKKLTDDDILRIARGSVTESAAATFTQLEIDTNLSVERGVIWLVHFIEFITQDLLFLNEVAASGSEALDCQLTKQTQTAILRGNDPDLIQSHCQRVSRSAAIGTDTGPLYFKTFAEKRFDFPMAVPVASQSLFLGIIGTDASGVHRVDIRIGYSLRAVSDKFFFRVAQALVG